MLAMQNYTITVDTGNGNSEARWNGSNEAGTFQLDESEEPTHGAGPRFEQDTEQRGAPLVKSIRVDAVQVLVSLLSANSSRPANNSVRKLEFRTPRRPP